MKEVSKSYPWLLDALVFLAGVVLVLIMGYLGAGVASKGLEAIGTGLVGAGLVSFLIKRLGRETGQEAIEVVAEQRLTIENECTRRTLSAKKVDVLGVALAGVLNDFVTDERLLRRILFENVHARLMFVNPLSAYVEWRAMEDGVKTEDLMALLKQSVIRGLKIHKRLESLGQNAVLSEAYDRTKVGSFEIRLIDTCPYCSIHHADDYLLWGLYMSYTRGVSSAGLRVPREQEILFGQLSAHFDRLWSMNSNNYLLRIAPVTAPFPRLNDELVEKVLGADWESLLENT